MSMAVALGLLSALLYGATDLVTRFAGRRVGTLRGMFYGHCIAAPLLCATLVVYGVPSGPAHTWALLVLADFIGLAATAFLYRALTFGVVSVVSPVAGTYGGVTAILSFLVGEHLGRLGAAGLLLTFVGGLIVATPQPARSASPGGRGWLASAGAAALLYGLSFWISGRYVIPVLGILVPSVVYYLLGIVSIPLFAWASRSKLSAPSVREAPFVLGATALGCGGSIALAAAQSSGYVAVATVLSALASAVTVLLAWLILKEKLPLYGWAGLAILTVGLATLHLD
jgi:drug/metabolite transporter (DMT)-like permease